MSKSLGCLYAYRAWPSVACRALRRLNQRCLGRLACSGQELGNKEWTSSYLRLAVVVRKLGAKVSFLLFKS